MTRKPLREKVLRRDKGICAECGFDCLQGGHAWVRYTAEVWGFFGRQTLFDADHIVPLALGGTDTLENMRTLCLLCHKKKSTKRDVPTIAKAKRTAKRAARMKLVLDWKAGRVPEGSEE